MKRLFSMLAALFAGSVQAEPQDDPLLLRLGAALLEKRHDYASRLQAPLSKSDIDALEKRFDAFVPESVRALYMWHDGQDPEVTASFANNMMFLPLEEALITKAEFDGMIGYDFELENWWHPGWLPLFTNGGGVYLVLDQVGVHTGEPGQLLYFFDDYENRPIVARSLKAFLTAVVDYYEQTPVEDVKESFDLDNFLPKMDVSFNAEGEATPLE